MKLRLISFLSFIAIVASPATGVAQSIEQLQAQITALLLQVQQLQLQVLQTKQAQVVAFCFNQEKDLKIGDKGAEVIQLHQALSKQGFAVGAEEEGGGLYGEATASAVTGFQEKYRSEILDPLKLNHGSGYLGKRTRDVLKRLYPCTGTTTVTVGTTQPTSNTNTGTTTATTPAKIVSFTSSADKTGNQPITLSWSASDYTDATITATCPKIVGLKVTNNDEKKTYDCASGEAITIANYVNQKSASLSVAPGGNTASATIKFSLILSNKGKAGARSDVSVTFSLNFEIPKVVLFTATPSSLSSGQETTFQITATGSVTHFNIFLACPDGVTSPSKESACGNWQTLSSGTTSYKVSLKNLASVSQAITATLYAYGSSGVSSPAQAIVTVSPQ